MKNTPLNQSALDRSLISLGQPNLFDNIFTRAKQGKTIVLGVIGGSITAGAAASEESGRWANLVQQWMANQFPDATIDLVNAGIGATGSNIGVHRVQKDLLSHKPDLVVVEFGVNDRNNRMVKQTYEGLLRQIRSPHRNPPAVICLFTMGQDGSNCQEPQSEIGAHYGLAMTSVRDAIWPRIEAGELTWEDYSPDKVHPNDWGHRCCARCVTYVMEQALASHTTKQNDSQPLQNTLPAPLHTDTFDHALLHHAQTLEPTVNQGWEILPDGPYGAIWQAIKPGSHLVFEIEAQAIGIIFHRIRQNMGMASVTVDDQPSRLLDGWFEETWGGYSHCEILADDLMPGSHIVRVELTDQTAPQSKGHLFQIRAILRASATPLSPIRS